MKHGHIHIGTSGWHYKHWVGNFYPTGTKGNSQLAYYAERFSTVEINNSFYKLPEKEIFRNWKTTVRSGFLFSVKASRYITHMKKLIVDQESLDRMFGHAAELGKKCGPILFQLPPNWKINTERLALFLSALPDATKCTFEFRHPSWHCDEVYALLTQHNCAFCIYDIAGFLSPVKVTANFAYIRLHGPGSKYQGSYDKHTLAEWAKQCQQWAEDGIETYVYFDNDQKGYAAENASTMQEIIKVLK